MRNSVLVVVLTAWAVCLAGCVIIAEDEEAICVADDPAIVEINAISRLSFDADRQRAYKRIAAREGLRAYPNNPEQRNVIMAQTK